MKLIYLAFAAIIFLAGCATNQTQESYADQVSSRPTPTTPDEKNQECTWIRSEIARQQSIAEYGTSIATSPFMAMAYQAAARRNIAALESRAATIQCDSAFSSIQESPSSSDVPQNTGTKNNLSFDECFARCQKLTDRTKDQCFDTCK